MWLFEDSFDKTYFSKCLIKKSLIKNFIRSSTRQLIRQSNLTIIKKMFFSQFSIFDTNKKELNCKLLFKKKKNTKKLFRKIISKYLKTGSAKLCKINKKSYSYYEQLNEFFRSIEILNLKVLLKPLSIQRFIFYN